MNALMGNGLGMRSADQPELSSDAHVVRRRDSRSIGHAEGSCALSPTIISLQRRSSPSVHHAELNRLILQSPDTNHLGDVTVACVGFGEHIETHCVNSDAYELYIAVHGSFRIRTGVSERVEVSPRRAVVVSPGQGTHVRWAPGATQLIVTIPVRRLHSELEFMLGEAPPGPVEFDTVMDLEATERGRAWLRALESLRHRDWMILVDYPSLAANFGRLLVQGLLLIQPHNYTGTLQEMKAGLPWMVRAATELVLANPEHAWTSTELARRVSVSVRHLQHGFRQSLGISPKQYIRNVRLDRVRAELQASDSSGTVSRVASRWGFNDHGRFAAAYRERFEESPSETLKKESRPSGLGGAEAWCSQPSSASLDDLHHGIRTAQVDCVGW